MQIFKLAKRGQDKLLGFLAITGICKRYEDDMFTVVLGNSEHELKFTSCDLQGLKMAVEALEEQQKVNGFFHKCDTICNQDPQIQECKLEGRLASRLNTSYNVPLAETGRICQAYFKHLNLKARNTNS